MTQEKCSKCGWSKIKDEWTTLKCPQCGSKEVRVIEDIKLQGRIKGYKIY